MSMFLKSLLQQRCLACAEPMSRPARGLGGELFSAGFCTECSSGLKPLRRGFCRVCGEIYGGGAEGICPGCQSALPPWSKIYFYAAYSGLLRDLTHRLKFAGALHIAPALGRLLATHPELATSANAVDKYDCIIPIPLHSSRLIERGFNQSTEIARELSKILGLSLLNGMKRRNRTRHQTGLSREQRLRNVRGAFQALPVVRGKKILLLDDVMTTGATLGVAAKALLQAGASGVDVAVIARTPARNTLEAVRHS